MEELPHVLAEDFVSCVHVRFYFFTAAHFHLTANISHYLTAAMKFSCFSSNEICLPSSFSVIHVSLNNIKNFLSLKVRAAMRFSSVAFGLPYLLIISNVTNNEIAWISSDCFVSRLLLATSESTDRQCLLVASSIPENRAVILIGWLSKHSHNYDKYSADHGPVACLRGVQVFR